ncbi:PaaI family thioesterase [Oceanospirillum sediminis]|uniref:PaaI family thioesterase n=1 Tax=Oceanospirillum sediminis TaxID=2760088 RepID=A0A839IPT0_9GAMM|nr:PaaI family thioesterase [Oceanospirillum sediminis]MBB1486512.1 PaaI family thioesterase [Oceanospirillum sediminis]
MNAPLPDTVMTTDEITLFLEQEFPQHIGHVVRLGKNTADMRLDVSDDHLRPGGTVSGPTMMALADVCLYVAILAQIGPVALAVTTSLNINFLRKPVPEKAILAQARLLKLGKRLAVGEISIFSEGEEEPVAHVTATYSIPPR